MITWHKNTELVAICLHLTPETDLTLPPNYTYGLLGWWLDRIRQDNPELSAYLHDGGAEKPFTLSLLTGLSPNPPHRLLRGNTYQWTISALYQPLCQWLATWLDKLPESLHIFRGSLTITHAELALPPCTYDQLWQTPLPPQRKFTLNFLAPTSFRSKKHHLPLPIPSNIFQSYYRRWQDFSGRSYNQEEFLAWVAEMVFVSGHAIATTKILAGKAGLVTGFTGWVDFGVEGKRIDRASALSNPPPDYARLLYTLLQLAPYCGTGHKTTFGLGYTRQYLDQKLEQNLPQHPNYYHPNNHLEPAPTRSIPASRTINTKKIDYLHDRIAELTTVFFEQRKRSGGNRASHTAQLWATILARRELGESLQDISIDLGIPYETVRTYAKRARKAINLS